MKSKTSAALLIVLIFLLGAVAGAVGTYIVQTHVMAGGPRSINRSGPHDVAEELAQGLSLNSDQKEKLKTIIHQSRERYRALSLQVRPQYDTIRNETRQEIRQILTEEQKARFEKIVQDIDERHKNHQHKANQ